MVVILISGQAYLQCHRLSLERYKQLTLDALSSAISTYGMDYRLLARICGWCWPVFPPLMGTPPYDIAVGRPVSQK